MRTPVSAVVLAQDEAACIERCIAHLGWADEVVVVDSGSSDGTQELARRAGARVVEQPWLGWSRQRNAAAAAASHDWVVFVDADEVMSTELVKAVLSVLADDPDPEDAWAMGRLDEYWGRLLPQMQRRSKLLDRVRLYHRGRSSWDEEMLVHEEVRVPGRKRVLPGHLLQWRPQRNWEMAQRIARYSQIEGAAIGSGEAPPTRGAAAVRLLVMPVARFSWVYGARGWWRLGLAGYVASVMRAHADFLRWAEYLQGPSAPPDPPADRVNDTRRRTFQRGGRRGTAQRWDDGDR